MTGDRKKTFLYNSWTLNILKSLLEVEEEVEVEEKTPNIYV